MDRNRFGGFGWGLNSLEFTLSEDGMADGFLTTGGRVRNLRFHRVEEWGRDMKRLVKRREFLRASTGLPPAQAEALDDRALVLGTGAAVALALRASIRFFGEGRVEFGVGAVRLVGRSGVNGPSLC